MSFIELQIMIYSATLSIVAADSVLVLLGRNIKALVKFQEFVPEFVILVGVFGSFFALGQALLHDASADSLLASLGISLSSTLLGIIAWLLAKVFFGIRFVRRA